MKYADHTEKRIADILEKLGILYRHESEGDTNGLDFYLPDYDVYIEIKRYPSERTERQITQAENIILIQGLLSINMLEKLL